MDLAVHAALGSGMVGEIPSRPSAFAINKLVFKNPLIATVPVLIFSLRFDILVEDNLPQQVSNITGKMKKSVARSMLCHIWVVAWGGVIQSCMV